MNNHDFDTDVIVIGSGFGGSVAALRFAEAGQRVIVLERGTWIHRNSFRADRDCLWNPERNRFGMHDIRVRGKHIVPWLGSGVGGGSHVFAGTLKRASAFAGYPEPIRHGDLTPYYERAEAMMAVTPYPSHAPYSACPATTLMLAAGARLHASEPELVEASGVVDLAVSFAPPGQQPGTEHVNQHGAVQRYAHPGEQALLGGDIDAKNTLDRNYLHLAQKHGTEIRDLCEVDRIVPLDGGGYRVCYRRWVPQTSSTRWPWQRRSVAEPSHLTARRVVLAAGAIGSTEILLRNRDIYKTLPALGRALGGRYTCNGNHLSLIVPFRGALVAWLGFAALLAGVLTQVWWLAVAGALMYYAQLAMSRPPACPDIGTTNSDYIRFRSRRGEPGGVYIESGRYPTPIRLGLALLLSALGWYRPERYRVIARIARLLELIPPFGALERTWPVPLLIMGRDDATGTMRLDLDQRLVIDYNPADNRDYYAYVDRLARKLARAARAWWLPNPLYAATGKLEIPHNQGGVPMGATAHDGVVDHAGRVFGYKDLMVLDGSIIPVSPGPNPALTILALAERAMDIACAQLRTQGELTAEELPQSSELRAA